MTYDPETPRCVVCDARVASGNSHCGGVACLRYEVRKEHIRKDQFDASNPAHFRLQSRGGAWRYYKRVGDEPDILECKIVNAHGVEMNENTPDEKRDCLYILGDRTK